MAVRYTPMNGPNLESSVSLKSPEDHFRFERFPPSRTPPLTWANMLPLASRAMSSAGKKIFFINGVVLLCTQISTKHLIVNSSEGNKLPDYYALKHTPILPSIAHDVPLPYHPATACPWQFTIESTRSFPLKVIVDRKSTRLNSSHVKISYAVFC